MRGQFLTIITTEAKQNQQTYTVDFPTSTRSLSLEETERVAKSWLPNCQIYLSWKFGYIEFGQGTMSKYNSGTVSPSNLMKKLSVFERTVASLNSANRSIIWKGLQRHSKFQTKSKGRSNTKFYPGWPAVNSVNLHFTNVTYSTQNFHSWKPHVPSILLGPSGWRWGTCSSIKYCKTN